MGAPLKRAIELLFLLHLGTVSFLQSNEERFGLPCTTFLWLLPYYSMLQ